MYLDDGGMKCMREKTWRFEIQLKFCTRHEAIICEWPCKNCREWPPPSAPPQYRKSYSQIANAMQCGAMRRIDIRISKYGGIGCGFYAISDWRSLGLPELWNAQKLLSIDYCFNSFNYKTLFINQNLPTKIILTCNHWLYEGEKA